MKKLAKQLYKLYLDDYSTASFTSLDKCYVGTLDDIGNFIVSIKNDKNISDSKGDLISAYEKYISRDNSAMHTVAHKNIKFLTKVKSLGCDTSSLADYNWEHTNTWGFPHQVEHNAPDTYNRLFVIEKEFGTKAEALQDMEAFKTKPDVNFAEVLNDIFGDG